MHFAITRTHFQNGLTKVSRLATGRVPLPILNSILISCEGGKVRLEATDLELGIRVNCPAKVEQPGSFTVPARLLSEFIQNCPDTTFEAKVVDEAVLNLKSEMAQAKIRGFNASEFPGLPFVNEAPTFHTSTQQLKEAIDSVSFASAIDDTRPVLAGVLLTGTKDQLTLAATDSYRLAERSIKTTKELKKPCSAIVPKSALLEFSRLLADEPGEASVFVGENQIQLVTGQVEVLARLIEGNYPNYQAIIPNEYRTRVTAHLGEFITSVKLANLFAREAGNVAKLAVTPGKGMTISSVADQKGEAMSRLTAIAEGEELTIAFNVKYLLEALSVIKADNVFVELTSPDRPALLRPANSKEYLSLIMPLKVD